MANPHENLIKYGLAIEQTKGECHVQPEAGKVTRRTLPLCAAVMGLCLFLFHHLINRQYGFHGDELYFIMCGNRLDWGYVDHPPFVPLVARMATDLMGVNLFALRFFPALTLGASCLLTGWLARRMGAGRWGEFIAALSFICAPVIIRAGAFLNIPCFEAFFWLLIAHFLIPICRDNKPRWWLAVGIALGFSLFNKHTTLFLGVGIAVGILITERRKDLLTPWPWLAVCLTLALFSPNLLWQYRHDWATLEFVRNLNANTMQTTSRTQFLLAQVILLNAVNVLLWIAAFRFFFRTPEGKPFRMYGGIFLTLLAIMLLFKAKVYYLAPAFPMLMAGGAVLIEKWRSPAKFAYTGALIMMALLFLPLSSPIGSLENKEDYIRRFLGFIVENPKELTFDYRFELGRPEQLAIFKKVVESLPEDDKRQCVILTSAYDTASQINLLGKDMGFPLAISGANNYYLWGPQGASGKCTIAFGYKLEFLRECFDEVTVAAEATCPWITSGNPNQPVYICRNPKAPLDQLWPKFKRY